MNYSVTSGQIKRGVLYGVSGLQSVVYNAVTYSTGERFRGINGLTDFAFTGSGTQVVNEVQEFIGGSIEFRETVVDNPDFPETTLLSGMAVEFNLTVAEKIVIETTKITGFAIELLDYPFYSFEIIETRL